MVLLDQSILAQNLDCLIHRFGFSDATLFCDLSTGWKGDSCFGIDVHTDAAVDGNVTWFQPVGEDTVVDEKEVFAFFFHEN